MLETTKHEDVSQLTTHGPARGWVLRLWLGIQKVILWYGLIASIYVLLRVTVGGGWTLVTIFNNFIPWCAAGGIFWGVIALFSRRRWLLISLQLSPIILFIVLYGHFLRGREPINPPLGGFRLTVSTYNVLSMASDVEEIIDVICDLDADIVGLQELGIGHGERFQEALRDIYPYQALFPGEDNFGVGILSRYPIEDSELLVTYENYRGDEHVGLMRATVDIDGSLITVFVAHPPVPSPFTFRDHVPRFYDESIRDGQMKSLQRRIENEDNPVLVLCDCNMTDQSQGYQALDGVLDDAFREVGEGLGFTVAPQSMGIPALLPLLVRVDYVWISDDFVAVTVVVGKDGGSSDHRPVMAELVLQSSSTTKG